MAAPSAGLVAFSHLQFSQIRGRQPYSIVRKIDWTRVPAVRVASAMAMPASPQQNLVHPRARVALMPDFEENEKSI
jgi:hypothetical protein